MFHSRYYRYFGMVKGFSFAQARLRVDSEIAKRWLDHSRLPTGQIGNPGNSTY